MHPNEIVDEERSGPMRRRTVVQEEETEQKAAAHRFATNGKWGYIFLVVYGRNYEERSIKRVYQIVFIDRILYSHFRHLSFSSGNL